MNTEAPKDKGKVAILAVAVALLVVGGLVAHTYPTKRNIAGVSSKGSSTIATGSRLTFFNSTISQDGLQIEVALNSTSLVAGAGLSAQVWLTNTLPRNVSLLANLTAFPGDPALEALGRGYPCDGAGPDGILNSGLYQGHYTAANFSEEAAPLILENPVGWNLGCPNPYGYVLSPPQSIEFAPDSAVATVAGQTMGVYQNFKTVNATAVPDKFYDETIVQNGSTTTSSAGTELDLAGGPVYSGTRGYWSAPPNASSTFIEQYTNSTILQALEEAHGLYHEFTPGPYTVVAEDYWNQTVFAHFVVRASPSSSGAANETIFIRVLSSASGRPLSNESVTAGPASSPNDISYSFGPGSIPTLNECVHEVSNGAVVQTNGEVVSNGTTTTYAPCPLKHYDTNSSGWVTISNRNASYFFIFVGTALNSDGSNLQVITTQGSRTYVTVTFPEGTFTVAGSESPG